MKFRNEFNFGQIKKTGNFSNFFAICYSKLRKLEETVTNQNFFIQILKFTKSLVISEKFYGTTQQMRINNEFS